MLFMTICLILLLSCSHVLVIVLTIAVFQNESLEEKAQVQQPCLTIGFQGIHVGMHVTTTAHITARACPRKPPSRSSQLRSTLVILRGYPGRRSRRRASCLTNTRSGSHVHIVTGFKHPSAKVWSKHHISCCMSSSEKQTNDFSFSAVVAWPPSSRPHEGPVLGGSLHAS